MNPARHNSGERFAKALWRRLAGGMVLFAASSLVNVGALGGIQESSPPQDLTGMSLEQLLHEEITPINVLGSHMHLKGQFMVGYRYMYNEMNHNLEGTRSVSDSEVLQEYPLVHTFMSMEMHMIELMYAPSDYVTVETMIPFARNVMDHLDDDGDTFPARSAGLSDLTFMGLVNLMGNPRAEGNRLLLNAGFTAPTGSIDEEENGARLEYPMQLGSGTWDLLPGLTYLGQSQSWSWGAQAMGTVRLGENENDYRLGNRYRLSAWTQYRLTDWVGPSARLDWHAWYDIHGADPELNPARNPAFDATKQAGERLDLLFGLHFYIPKGVFKGNRFSVEGGVPIYQRLDGPNLGTDWLITASWSWSFH